MESAVIHHNTNGDNTIVAAVAGKRIRVHAFVLVCAAAATVRFESGASGTALTGQMSFTDNGGVSADHNPAGWFETAAGELLNMELNGAVYVDGVLTYSLVNTNDDL